MSEKIYVTKAFLPPLEEYIEQISDLWNTHILTNAGKIHNELEEKLREYLQVENCILLCNGHMGLELALQAFHLEGEVITTPFTFASTTNAIIRSGLTPVFADIKPDDYTIDPDSVERLITDRTCAILPVHVYGNVCDVERLQKIADKYHIKLIYDAAHAFGVEYKHKAIGSYGDASVFSFHATKPFHAIEGGAIVTKDKRIRENILHMRNFGISSDNEDSLEIGPNGKMSEFHAAMGICNLRHIKEITKARRRVVEKYYENLKEVKGVKVYRPNGNVKSNYAYFPIVVDANEYGEDRDELCQRLQKHEIYPRKYFYPLTKNQACHGNRFMNQKTPIAEYISESILALPLYVDLEMQNVDRICDIIRRK